MMRWTVLVLLLVFALAGCDLGPDPIPAKPPEEPSPSASEVEPSDPASTAPDGITTTGVLGGDAQLEGGCVWLETDQGRIEPMWPSGYTVTTDPIALLDPEDETVAEEGDSITITGSPARDIATICQVGEVWTITDVTVEDAG